MHYYQHHIGDFIKATSRLTDAQAMAYLRLLWMYYDSEKPLPNDVDVLSLQVGLPVDELQLLLRAYFRLEDGVWKQTRCDAEIAEYRSFIDKKSQAGKASAEQRKNKRTTHDEQVLNECSTDVQLTNNHKPITNNQINTTLARPDDISEELWKDFKKLRDKKKAPITELVLTKIRAEAKNAGITLSQAMEEMCVRGWTAFKADWVKSKDKPSSGFDEMLRRAK
jgi:uncharacterized protein YdaU (DUF1376 family)